MSKKRNYSSSDDDNLPETVSSNLIDDESNGDEIVAKRVPKNKKNYTSGKKSAKKEDTKKPYTPGKKSAKKEDTKKPYTPGKKDKKSKDKSIESYEGRETREGGVKTKYVRPKNKEKTTDKNKYKYYRSPERGNKSSSEEMPIKTKAKNSDNRYYRDAKTYKSSGKQYYKSPKRGKHYYNSGKKEDDKPQYKGKHYYNSGKKGDGKSANRGDGKHYYNSGKKENGKSANRGDGKPRYKSDNRPKSAKRPDENIKPSEAVTIDTKLSVFKSTEELEKKCKNYYFKINETKPPSSKGKPHAEYEIDDYINKDDNIFYDYDIGLKKDLLENSEGALKNTINYIWNYVKVCVMVKIKNNKLHTFYPFCNKEFEQTWGNNISLGKEDNKDIDRYLAMKKDKLGHNFEKYAGKIIRNKSKWWCNGSLIDNRTHENNMYGWSDSMLNYFFHMIHHLCLNREIPDCTFFINKRDKPILLLNDDNEVTYPYPEFLDNVEEISVGNKFVPIFSPYVGVNNVDIALPCIDDYKNALGGIVEKSCRDKIENFNITVPKWRDRKSAAIFRGSSTGSVFLDNNQRIKLAMLSNVLADTSILDAGIVSYSERDGREYGSPMSFYDTKNEFNIVSERMGMEDQVKYKYAIYVQGHSAAGRLSTLLKHGFVVLYVKPTTYSRVHWFSGKLVEYVHYISVENDLSNLISVINWCKNNDRKCETISRNAMKFCRDYIEVNSIYDYMQKCLVEACK